MTVMRISIKIVLFMAFILVDSLSCFPQHRVKSSTLQSITKDICHNLSLMNHYLAMTYPDIVPPRYLSVDSLTSGDMVIIRNNETFYRFLSTVSGLSTPYNRIPRNLRIEGNDWIYCKDHIDLVNWYVNNIDRISCEEFNEYYHLLNYVVPYPKKGEEWFDYVDRIGLYQDSINTSLKMFESRYNSDNKEENLIFPWSTDYSKEELSKIKSLINSTNKISIIIMTR